MENCMQNKLKKLILILKNIQKLPKVTIKFKNMTANTLNNYKETYIYFTKLHRLKLFRNKTLGIALIDLNLYQDFDKYYKSINGKNSAAY